MSEETRLLAYFVGTEVKGRISRRVLQENFRKNEHFLPPDTHTCLCVSRGKKCSFSRKFGVLCFLVTPALRFTLLPYCQGFCAVDERRFIAENLKCVRNENSSIQNKLASFFMSNTAQKMKFSIKDF